MTILKVASILGGLKEDIIFILLLLNGQPHVRGFFFLFLTKNLSISLIKDHNHKTLTLQSIYKTLQNHSHILIILDTNKILTIK
jgi:hypothetical protein